MDIWSQNRLIHVWSLINIIYEFHNSIQCTLDGFSLLLLSFHPFHITMIILFRAPIQLQKHLIIIIIIYFSIFIPILLFHIRKVAQIIWANVTISPTAIWPNWIRCTVAEIGPAAMHSNRIVRIEAIDHIRAIDQMLMVIIIIIIITIIISDQCRRKILAVVSVSLVHMVVVVHIHLILLIIQQ